MKKLLIFMLAILMVMGTASALTIFNIHIGIPGTENTYIFSNELTSVLKSSFVTSSGNTLEPRLQEMTFLPNGVSIQPNNDLNGDGQPVPDDPVQITISTDKTNYFCDNDFECELVNIEILKTGAPLNENVYLIIDSSSNSGKITKINNFQQQGNKKRYVIEEPFPLPNGKKFFDTQMYAYGSGKFNISIIGASTGTVYQVLDPWFNSSYLLRQQFNVTTIDSFIDWPIRFELDTATLISNNQMQSDCDDIVVTQNETVNISQWVGTL